MMTVRPLLLALMGLVLLTACGGPSTLPLPEIGYTAPPLRLDAEGPVEVVDLYRPPLRAPHVEHRFRVAPAQIARAWARDRLDLTGGAGAVKLTIMEASVIEEPIAPKGGLFGWLRADPERRLVARLAVQLDFVGATGAASTEATAIVTRTVLEGVDEAALERVYFEMIEELETVFDAEMARELTRTFQPAFQRAA